MPELVGRAQPDLLLVNDDDLAYAKIRLDERSLATALAHPRGFQDSLPRALVLGAAWDMTRDAEMPARAFVDLVLASLPGETDSTLLRTLLGQLQTTVLLYTAEERRQETLARTVASLKELARRAEPASDAQLQLVTTYAGMLTSAEDAGYVRGLLEGTEVLDGLAIDTEMRWTLLTSMAAAGAADEAQVRAERERDNTSTGREREARALAARPTPEAKAAAWAAGVESDQLPNSVLDATSLGFGRAVDPTLLLPYVEKYHAMLLEVWDKRTHAIAESIVQQFYPAALANQELLDATQAWLDAHHDAPAALVRLVSENRDSIARALRAQDRDARG